MPFQKDLLPCTDVEQVSKKYDEHIEEVKNYGRMWDPDFRIHKNSRLIMNYINGELNNSFWTMQHIILQHYIVNQLHDKTEYHKVMEQGLKDITQYFKDCDDVHWVDNWKIVRQTCVPIYKLHFFLKQFI